MKTKEIGGCPQRSSEGPAQSANNVYNAWPGGGLDSQIDFIN